MNKKDKDIIHRVLTSLQRIPARGNAMSMQGASQYSYEIKEALRMASFVLYSLEAEDYDEAYQRLDFLQDFSFECEKKAK